MIKCYKCQNNKKFSEIHVGGYREHQWTQDPNGRFVFDGSNYDKAEDTIFECGKCGADLADQYRAFLRALFDRYSEEKYGD